MADVQSRLNIFSVGFLNRTGDIKDRVIQRRHLALDALASGVFASGYFEAIQIDGPTTAGYVLTADADGWGTWQVAANDHSTLTNLEWSAAGHTIDDDIVPTASGANSVGTVAVPFGDGTFDDLYVSNTPTIDQGVTNKMYVDSQIQGENHWDMASGMLYTYVPTINIVPNASGSQIIGTQTKAFSEGNFGTLRSDAVYATELYTSQGSLHLGINTVTVSPSGTLQLNGEDISGETVASPGTTLQVVYTQDGEYADGSVAIPRDDSIPQNDEGVEFMTKSITPRYATSILKIDIVFNFALDNGNKDTIFALFQDDTADALAAVSQWNDQNDHGGIACFTHFMTAGTTSSTTFKLRAGTSDGTKLFLNGYNNARTMGGVMASSMTITEIAT